MAELVGLNVNQGRPFTIRIPSAGEVFRDPASLEGNFYYREGNILRAGNLESLGLQLFTPTTEKPTYGHLSPAERQGLGKQVLQAQGIDFSSIPTQNYNMADVQGYFGRGSGDGTSNIQPLTDLSTLGKAVKSTTLVPKANITLSGGTLEGLNNAQQKEFQDVLSGVSQGTQSGATFTRTPKGILDQRTGQIVQSTTAPSAVVTPDNLGVSVQIRNLENKIDDQLANLKAGFATGGASEILENLFTRFGVAESQSLLKEYNQTILKQQKLLREIPDNIKTTLQDVGISEAQYNRLVLQETRKPLEMLRDLMEKKGAAEEAVNNALRFVGLFSDAELKDRAVKLELAKFEIETSKDLLKELNIERRSLREEDRQDQREFIKRALDFKKDDLTRIQKAAETYRENGGTDANVLNSILNQENGDDSEKILTASGFGAKRVKPDDKWSEPYSLGGDIVQRNNSTGEIKKVVDIATGGSGNTLTLQEASRFGIPLSLVGKSESQIAVDLDSDAPPTWFTQSMNEKSQQSLLPSIVQSMWVTFRDKTKKTLETQTRKKANSIEDLLISEDLARQIANYGK